MEAVRHGRNLRKRGPARHALRAEFGLGLHGPVAGRGAALEGRAGAPSRHEQQPEPRVAALEEVAAVPAAARSVLVVIIKSILWCRRGLGRLPPYFFDASVLRRYLGSYYFS